MNVAMVLAGVQTATAQANRATITGAVTDTSGAVVPGVEVTATNKASNIQTKAVASDVGIYVVPNLPPGEYSVEFKMSGFEKVEFPSLTLESTQVARLDATLKPGTLSTSITVTSQAPVLEEERPSVGTNISTKILNELPLSIYSGGRFVEDFAVAITPGYSPISSPYGAVVNGGQWFTKDYTVDGTSGTADIQGNSMQNGPAMEAIQEVQATTSGLDVQSSITGGGVIAFNLKSGTNKLHGSGFTYGHNEILDANAWTNNNQGIHRDRDRRWDFGGSLGGPIRKNKTFFFGTFERYTQTDFRLGGFSSVVPTSDFLSGNFSALLGPPLCTQSDGSVNDCSMGGTAINIQNNAGQTVALQAGMIFDPLTGNQFTGNAIPSSRFSSVAQKIVAIYQKSYAPQTPGLNANDRLPSDNSPAQTPNEFVVKLDHNLGERDRLAGSWVFNHKPRTLVDSGGVWEAGTTDGGPLSAARNNAFHSHQFRLSESRTFTPTILNVANFTYNYDWQGDHPSAAGTWAQQLGLGSGYASNFPLISFGNDVNGYNETFIGNSFQGSFSGVTAIFGDTVTWTKGKHNLTFGGDFHAHQVNSHAGSGALSINFSNDTTGAASTGYGNRVGFGFASFLLGDSIGGKATTPLDLYGRQKSMSFFGQDNFKVTPKLTLNLGLRWVYNFRFHEKYGHWANYDLQAIDPVLGIPGTLVYAKNGSDSFEKNEYLSNFGPDLGFAYSPFQKLVFRGSFNMIYFPVGVAYFNGVPDGFAPGFQGTNSVSQPFNWDSGYPGVFKPGNKTGDPSTLFPLVNVDPRALHVGYSNAVNVGAQFELTPDMRLEVAYVGNRGHRLTDTALAWNEGSTSTFLKLANKFPDINSYNYPVCSASDAAGYGIPYPYSGFCGTLLAAITPYPQVGAAFFNPYTYGGWYYPSLNYVGLPLGQSFYNSLVVDWVKRTGRGLTMDLNYTWSREESDTFSSQQEYNGYYTPVQDFSNLSQAAHTITGYDLAHIVKGYVNYELPFGRGRRWLASHGRIANGFLGGWTVAGIVNYYSGQPFRVGTQDPYWPMWGNLYPNFALGGFTGPTDPSAFQESRDPNQQVPVVTYMPKNVAYNPPAGQLGIGPAAIPELRCPGGANENASLLKYFPMGSDGRYLLSFRAEFYNIFNRHAYSIVGCGGNPATIGADNFGQVTGVNDAGNPARSGQFAIRFDF